MFDEHLKKYGFLFKHETENFPGIGEMTQLLGPGQELRKQREALGLTQQQVAKLAGIDIRQYQRLESGERSVCSTSLRIGLNVCYALKIDPMYYCTAPGANMRSESAQTDQAAVLPPDTEENIICDYTVTERPV